MDDTAAWPAVNTLVTLTGDAWDGPVRSRVEDADGTTVVLAAPDEPGRDGLPPLILVPPPGTDICVSWTHPRGMSELHGQLVRAFVEPTPQWRVQAQQPAQHIQRRDDVRVPILLGLELRLAGSVFHATTVDVSAGGLRCIVPDAEGFRSGEKVDVELDIAGGPMRATAELIRTRRAHDGFTEVTARFIGMHDADVQRMRKFLFAEQVAQRARERNFA